MKILLFIVILNFLLGCYANNKAEIKFVKSKAAAAGKAQNNKAVNENNLSKDSVKYFDTNYFDVLKLASKDGKMMFIDFYAVWCGGCKAFDKKIKYDSSFMNYVKGKFNTVQINTELKKNKSVVSKYRIWSLPTFVITDSKGKEIGRIVGLEESKPEYLIERIEKVIQGKESLEFLKQQYFTHPDSLELFTKIVDNQFLERWLFKAVIQFSDSAIIITNNPALKEAADYYKAYSMLYDIDFLSPKAMTDFINKSKNNKFVENGLSELCWFYDRLNKTDSVIFYRTKLVSLNSDTHFKYVRDFARFLYKQNVNISLADQLTKEYSESKNTYADHWTPYLKANELAKKGKLKEAIKVFDDWMKKYTINGIKEDYWHYQFYIDFALFYKVISKHTIKYARMVEDYNPDISNKTQLADVYFLNGKNYLGNKKLKEIKNIIEDPEEKANIDNLIKSHSKNK